MTDTEPACPCCGAQQLLGVWLPRRKAEIVERLLKLPAGARLPSNAFGVTVACFKVHVYHINSLLAATDWEVRGKRGEGYRVQKR